MPANLTTAQAEQADRNGRELAKTIIEVATNTSGRSLVEAQHAHYAQIEADALLQASYARAARRVLDEWLAAHPAAEV